MVPHQIYQALTDQRAHELAAAARRHERMAEAQFLRTDRTEPSSRLNDAVAHLAALVRVRRGSHAGSTTAAAPSAGPMGCVA